MLYSLRLSVQKKHVLIIIDKLRFQFVAEETRFQRTERASCWRSQPSPIGFWVVPLQRSQNCSATDNLWINFNFSEPWCHMSFIMGPEGLSTVTASQSLWWHHQQFFSLLIIHHHSASCWAAGGAPAQMKQHTVWTSEEPTSYFKRLITWCL